MRILIVEDHPDLAATLGDYLAARGHTVDFAGDGNTALALAHAQEFDAIVLDRVLPGLDGVNVCRQLREAGSSMPVLMLTAMDAVDDRVAGLGAGADDYLVKPFALTELEARLDALHRRATGAVAAGMLRVDDLEYDPQTRSARRSGRDIVLNPTTRKILEHLMRNTARVTSRAELEHLLWGDQVPEGDVLRAHIHVLRRELDRGQHRKLLHTVRGAGYRVAVIDHDATP